MQANMDDVPGASKDPDEPEMHAKCCECNTWYPIGELSGFWESESWEMPQEYFVHECPTCPNGGCICDYEARAAYDVSKRRSL